MAGRSAEARSVSRDKSSTKKRSPGPDDEQWRTVRQRPKEGDEKEERKAIEDSASIASEILGTVHAPESGSERPQRESQPNQAPAWLGKRNYFFRKWGSSTRQRLQMDEVASFSVTECGIADSMATQLLRFQPSSERGKRWSVIDGTACVGGNTIAFSKVFEHVHAVERDEARCAMLRNNLSVLECSNVTCVCGDFVSVLPDLPDHEVLFLDPEWGGPEYLQAEKVALSVGAQPLSEICSNAFSSRANLRVIALKVPNNFDLDGFTVDLNLHRPPRVFEYRKMKMVVLTRADIVPTTNATESRSSPNPRDQHP